MTPDDLALLSGIAWPLGCACGLLLAVMGLGAVYAWMGME